MPIENDECVVITHPKQLRNTTVFQILRLRYPSFFGTHPPVRRRIAELDEELFDMAGNRQLSLLLVLAALGAALILYRLALIGERHSKPVTPPIPRTDHPGSSSGPPVWRKRIIAVGDLHGGT